MSESADRWRVAPGAIDLIVLRLRQGVRGPVLRGEVQRRYGVPLAVAHRWLDLAVQRLAGQSLSPPRVRKSRASQPRGE